MQQLTVEESRLLGVLIEKAATTPEQYPLSPNALLAGANQKSNRDPVMAMDEGSVFDAIEGLRSKGLAIRVDAAGSRTNRYRHNATDALRVRPAELALLAELLLRGPQTLGELRGRASRIHPFEALEDVRNMIRALSDRDEPLVEQIPPAPGSRAERYAQRLCPDDRAQTSPPGDEAASPAPDVAPNSPQSDEQAPRMQEEISTLRADLAALSDDLSGLRAEFTTLRAAFLRVAQAMGETNPLE